MPHYKCGTEAKPFDLCRFKHGMYVDGKWAEVMREGVILDIQPGPTTCNAQVGFVFIEKVGSIPVLKSSTAYVTLNECEKAGLPLGT